jgi:hypothetical protein
MLHPHLCSSSWFDSRSGIKLKSGRNINYSPYGLVLQRNHYEVHDGDDGDIDAIFKAQNHRGIQPYKASARGLIDSGHEPGFGD